MKLTISNTDNQAYFFPSFKPKQILHSKCVQFTTCVTQADLDVLLNHIQYVWPKTMALCLQSCYSAFFLRVLRKHSWKWFEATNRKYMLLWANTYRPFLKLTFENGQLANKNFTVFQLTKANMLYPALFIFSVLSQYCEISYFRHMLNLIMSENTIFSCQRLYLLFIFFLSNTTTSRQSIYYNLQRKSSNHQISKKPRNISMHHKTKIFLQHSSSKKI